MDERSTLLILISIILIWTLPSLICGRLPKFVHSNDVMQINREQAKVILTLYTNDRRKCHWQCEKSVGVRNTMLKGIVIASVVKTFCLTENFVQNLKSPII